MISKDHQKGVGLIEVLVALVVLAIGVLGYVMLQMRALEATAESAQRVQAINIARDLAERIRVNRDGWTFGTASKSYLTEMSDAEKQTDTNDKDCGSVTAECNGSELADYDVKEIVTFAQNLGMSMNLMQCPKQSASSTTNGRYCVYVAWGNTSATNDAGTTDCTNGASYNTKSTCVIMELYQ
ncbi:type IV pilus modification protein PilV [Acinetobacter variabilis]|uniref:type IV pilus modification protein PilV n=1 Tax=Acinetobacter TaxID=469 RepID=UPI003D76AEE0